MGYFLTPFGLSVKRQKPKMYKAEASTGVSTRHAWARALPLALAGFPKARPTKTQSQVLGKNLLVCFQLGRGFGREVWEVVDVSLMIENLDWEVLEIGGHRDETNFIRTVEELG